jgi:hypothetical protein
MGERGLTCEVCGDTVESSTDIFCHEEWSYDISQTPAVAALTRIVLICRLCHHCEHFGNTQELAREGQISAEFVEKVIAHFCEVNRIGRAEFERHRRDAFAEWDELSALKWRVDYGRFKDVGHGST